MTREERRKRTEARKAAGVDQTYSQHTGKPAKAAALKPLPVIGPPCPDLGERVSGGGCGSPLLHCNRFGDITTRFTACKDAQRCCRDCEHNPVNAAEGVSPPAAPGGLVIDHGAGGIGDGLLGLCAVAQLSAEHPSEAVEYRVSATALPFVELFDGYTTLGKHRRPHSEAPVPGTKQLNAGYQAENRGKYPVPRWERYAKNIGASGVLMPKLREPETVKAAGADLAGCVALLPFSTDRTREWSLQHWLTLEARLHAAGYHTAVLHSDAKPLVRFAGAKVAGASAERVAGVLANACCAVGTDSGLAHLAGILGTPTVVLGGSTPVERIFGVYPRVTCLQGGLACSGCCGGTGVAVSGLEERCRASCSNLQSITPERVMQEVDRVWLKETLTCDASGCRTLLTADRLASLRDLAIATNHLPGDVAELGCFRGGSAKVLFRYTASAHLWLFDTFAGIPADDAQPGGHHKVGEFACAEEDVRAFLLAGEPEGDWRKPRLTIRRGVFPESIGDNGDPHDGLAFDGVAFGGVERHEGVRFRLVHLDADTYQSTAAALAYFAPRMVKGGVIVLDDLGWWACPGVGRACHEAGFRPERSAEYQGVIRKP